MRIAVASEEITARPAEGLLVFVMHLCRYLRDRHELLVLHRRGDPDPSLRPERVLRGKTLVSRDLSRLLKERKPDLLIYIPASGLTGFGMLRSALLRRSAGTPAIVIALQAREVGRLHRIVSLWNAPEIVLSPVSGMRERLEGLRIRTDLVIPGYDPDLFAPVDAGTKMRLREKHGIRADRYVVLHVGHLRESRNLQTFLRYREWAPDVLPVIKAGEVDPAWRARLREAGVLVIDEYTEAVQELYQAADLYLFPVSARTGALEFPLSVIEACACNLPVLTTRFGALEEVLEDGGGLEWYSTVAEIPGRIRDLRAAASDTRSKVRDLSWTGVFDRYLAPHIEELGALPGGGR